MQDPSSAPQLDTTDAGAMSAAAVLSRDDSASALASKAARQLVLDAAAKQQAADDGIIMHVHGDGGTHVATGSKRGNQVLNVSNLGLSELPQDVLDAGARSLLASLLLSVIYRCNFHTLSCPADLGSVPCTHLPSISVRCLCIACNAMDRVPFWALRLISCCVSAKQPTPEVMQETLSLLSKPLETSSRASRRTAWPPCPPSHTSTSRRARCPCGHSPSRPPTACPASPLCCSCTTVVCPLCPRTRLIAAPPPSPAWTCLVRPRSIL